MKHIIFLIFFISIISFQVWGAPGVGINGNGCAYYNIQDAVDASSSGDTIQVSAGTYNENIIISSKNLIISGDYASDCTTTGGGTTTVDAGGSGAVFNIMGSKVTLENFQITGGYSSLGGGLLIADESRITLNQTDVFENAATYGGGVYLALGTQLTMNESNIHDNTATNDGGGVRVWGTLTANDTYSDIYNNSAPDGGGLSVPGGTVNLTGADLYGNQATGAEGKGGAIHAYDSGEIILDGSVWFFNDNQAYNGAGIYADASTITGDSDNIVFRDNIATNNGGAIYLSNSSVLNLDNAQIGYDETYENQAVRGAGIYMDNSTANLTGTRIINNTASYGGGIYVYSGDLNFLNNNTINYNSAVSGGAIYQYGGTIDFKGAWTVEYNSAMVSGGALLITREGSKTSFYAEGTSSISNNHAGSSGGAVMLDNSNTLKLHATQGYNLNILDNHAGMNGGAFCAENGGYFDTYGQLIMDGNNATGNGGVFYLTNGSKVWLDDYATSIPKIQSNWALNGGAIYAVDSPSVQCDGAEFGDTVDGNYAADGSGGAIYLSNSTLDSDNCNFLNNQATENGGAIAAFDSSALAFSVLYTSEIDPLSGEASSLNNNAADSDTDGSGNGGAIYSSDSSLEIAQTYLHHNTAVRGGAIFQEGENASSDISNCLIHHNTVTTSYGAGIRSENGDLSLTHTTIADNIDGAGFSANTIASFSAYNNIVWGNTSGGFSRAPDAYGCNIDNSANGGINDDPLFVAPGSGGNYHLQIDSPARNICGNAGSDTDLENNMRPWGTGYEMGAYEVQEYTVNTITNPVEGGTVTGAGDYILNSSAEVAATNDSGYVFVHWSAGNTILTCNDSYSFTVTRDITLQATFSAEQSEYLISSVSANHGTISGDGTYSHGSEVTLTASPNSGYRFSHWIETWDGFDGSIIVFTDEEYTFTADRDRNLTAVFMPRFNPGVLMLLLDE